MKVLLLLAIQNCSKNLIMRYAMQSKPDILYSAAVIGSETTKLTLSVLYIIFVDGGSLAKIWKFLQLDYRNMILLCVPATVYNIQQTLEYVALSNIDASAFSVLVQTKLLATAIFAVVLMGRKLNRAQTLSLTLLTTGVMLCNMKTETDEDSKYYSSKSTGIMATLGISLSSGFASVYTEKVIKVRGNNDIRSNYSLAYMQVQLASASLIIIGCWALVKDFSKIREVGLWYNFNTPAFLSVFNSAIGGLTVAAVLKFADAVLKGYATALSVVLTGLLSMFIFGTQLSSFYFLGMINVIVSMLLYNNKSLYESMC
ncbi:hypothetical protein TrCOL_g2448 [Triparma columacea]|uniref:CMP-sialic acid transporter n=1 Tax=Triparma columacea TaxID=722753 RepID=A0A9W7GFQ7_9STRA|nr:hypothetical protein TrCOL_g2448 [Triparma columacea]